MWPLDLWKPNPSQLFNMAIEYYVRNDFQSTNLSNIPNIRKMNLNNHYNYIITILQETHLHSAQLDWNKRLSIPLCKTTLAKIDIEHVI